MKVVDRGCPGVFVFLFGHAFFVWNIWVVECPVTVAPIGKGPGYAYGPHGVQSVRILYDLEFQGGVFPWDFVQAVTIGHPLDNLHYPVDELTFYSFFLQEALG